MALKVSPYGFDWLTWSNSLSSNFANKKTSMARSTFKVLFYVNGSKEKNGIVPIMGRVTINGTVAQFSCKQSILKTLWDVKGNKAKGKSVEARNINLALDNIKAQIIKHYQKLSDPEAFVTAEMVRNAYQGIGSEYETLVRAFDKDCANFLKRVGKDRTIGTYKVMVRSRNYVAAFIKSFYKRTDMSMLELTPDFIKAHGRPDVIILDPPRAGIHPDVAKVILGAKPQRIVYVSCNPASQARDLEILCSEYRITDVQPVDMFPHTHHVENVVKLELK